MALHHRRDVLAGSAALALNACGGGGISGPAPGPAPTPAQPSIAFATELAETLAWAQSDALWAIRTGA
jgi:hypothetical protein